MTSARRIYLVALGQLCIGLPHPPYCSKFMTKTCPNCSQPNPSDAAFCLNCASPLGPTVGGAGYQQQSPPRVGADAPYVGAPPQPYLGGQPPAMPGGASQRAIIALVLAIVGLVCCGPFAGVPAAIVGWLELGDINNGKAPAAGKWMAQVGLWGGIAVTVLHVVLYVFYMLFAMVASAPYGY